MPIFLIFVFFFFTIVLDQSSSFNTLLELKVLLPPIMPCCPNSGRYTVLAMGALGKECLALIDVCSKSFTVSQADQIYTENTWRRS